MNARLLVFGFACLTLGVFGQENATDASAGAPSSAPSEGVKAALTETEAAGGNQKVDSQSLDTDTVKGKLSDAGDSISNGASAVGESVSNGAESVKNAAKDAVDSTKQSLGEAKDGASQAGTDAKNNAKAAVGHDQPPNSATKTLGFTGFFTTIVMFMIARM